MGRQKDTDILGGLEKRLSSPAPVERPTPAEPAAAPSKKPSTRDGKKFVGFYADLDLTERLRTLAFETRREKQDLMSEALDLLLNKYGQ